MMVCRRFLAQTFLDKVGWEGRRSLVVPSVGMMAVMLMSLPVFSFLSDLGGKWRAMLKVGV
jgi:hypothetical protein